MKLNKYLSTNIFFLLFLILCTQNPVKSEVQKRTEVTFLRGPYIMKFYKRHNFQYKRSAAIHIAHGEQHDILILNLMDNHKKVDEETNDKWLYFLENPPRLEPTMEYYGPWTALVEWDLYRAIDWTHMHHEQTYDILSDKDISWSDKKKWTDRSVDYYLNNFNIPRSPAPLEVTMRRAGVMMKPYFSLFRNYYPKSNTFFYYAHWWHPVIYEAMMIGGNGKNQDTAVKQVEALTPSVLKERPRRMLLSREGMPRYSMMSPESANIFDNLHMLHGIAYDILSYDKWSNDEKQKELERVIKAMSYHKGDEKLARKFTIKYPCMDPRIYYDWMKPLDGAMTDIMVEMFEEMMPMLFPEGIDEKKKQRIMHQFLLKLDPGFQKGEYCGSLADALKIIAPDINLDANAQKAGVTPKMMTDKMLKSWYKKNQSKYNIPMINMQYEPRLLPCKSKKSS